MIYLFLNLLLSGPILAIGSACVTDNVCNGEGVPLGLQTVCEGLGYREGRGKGLSCRQGVRGPLG